MKSENSKTANIRCARSKQSRGTDVYVVQSLHGGPSETANDKLCRLLFFIGAIKDAGADRVTAVVPYLCYARKDRRTKPNDPVTTRYIAGMFEAVGTDCVVTLEVHNPVAFENAFRCRTVTLTGTPLFVDYIRALKDDSLSVVSPDTGGAKRAELLRETLETVLGRSVRKAFADKHRSAGVVSGDLFVGDVTGATALVIDDLISTGGTLLRAARAARKAGARRVIALVTHGLFMAGSAEVLADPAIDRLVITDAVPAFRLASGPARDKVDILPTAPLLAETIRRLHDGEALDRPPRFLKRSLDPDGICRGKPQIGAAKARPFFRRARIRLQQMGNGEPRPQHRAVATIEKKQFFGQAVAQAACHAAPDVFTGPGSAEPLAFKAQECNLIERIDGSQAGIELEAIDDLDGIAEPDVLRAKVAVSIDDTTMANAPSEDLVMRSKKATLDAIDLRHQPRGQTEAWVEQYAAIVG